MPVAQPFLNTPGQVGALAGYSDGMRMSYGLADLDREFRDRDLANKSNTLKYEEDLANVPLNEATRGVKMGMAGIDQSLINQGLVEQGRKDDFALKGQQVTSGQQNIDEATRQERAEAVQEGIQILKNPSLANSDTWTEYYNKMTEKHKMRGLSPNFQDPKNGALLNAANQAYVNSAPHLRGMELGAQREAGDLAQEELRGRTATTNANIIAAREGTPPTVDKKIAMEARKVMEATGGTLPVDMVDAYRSAMDKKDNTAIATRAASIMTQLHREKREGTLQKYAAERGITITDNNFSLDDLSVMIAEKELNERGMLQAWKELGSPKLTLDDLAKVSKEYPKFAKAVTSTPEKIAPARSNSASASAPAQPKAPVKEISQAEFEQKIALAKQQNPSIPEADLRASAKKRYRVLGTTPVSTPATSQGAIDSHVPPSVQRPFNPSITNALEKFSYQDTGVD